MPWPMVHFAIAEKLFDHEPLPEFLLGSIAPDAIHMRENTTRQDKNKTHLCRADGTMPDLITFRNFLKENLNKYEYMGWKSFVLGYVSHLYADLRWTETVWVDYTEKKRQSNDKNEPIKNQYNQEVCQIDFDLYRKEEWTWKIFALLVESREYSMDPLLACKEISQYREKTINWLKDETNIPRIKPKYITEEIVREFINKTTNELKFLIKDWNNV